MTDLILPRRSFLTGMAALLAAPAIVRASSLMPVKAIDRLTFETNVISSGDTIYVRVDGILRCAHMLSEDEKMGSPITLDMPPFMRGDSVIEVERGGVWSNPIYLTFVSEDD